MQKSALVIAIDGPSASGKSTVSRIVARRLNFNHVDSGSLYRGVAWFLLERKTRLDDARAVAAALGKIRMDFMARNNAILFSINGSELESELRSEAVNEIVSPVAALPAVREWVVDRLRRLVAYGSLVMEGRDIGTAVFPDAPFKFYLDASPAERARRRALESGGMPAFEAVLRSITKRDKTDSTRARDPLKVAEGALVIQTTQMSAGQVADLIVSAVSRKEG